MGGRELLARVRLRPDSAHGMGQAATTGPAGAWVARWVGTALSSTMYGWSRSASTANTNSSNDAATAAGSDPRPSPTTHRAMLHEP